MRNASVLTLVTNPLARRGSPGKRARRRDEVTSVTFCLRRFSMTRHRNPAGVNVSLINAGHVSRRVPE